MSARERFMEAARSSRVLPSLMVDRAAHRMGIAARTTVTFDLEALRFPDTKVAKDAEEECRKTVSPMLYNHSVRTYIFGLMLAQRDGLEPSRCAMIKILRRCFTTSPSTRRTDTSPLSTASPPEAGSSPKSGPQPEGGRPNDEQRSRTRSRCT